METQKRGRKPKAGTKESPAITKVTNVEVEKSTAPREEYIPAAKVRSKPMYDVFIKGQLRQLTKSAFEVAAKDPALDVQLPPNSSLELPKPCEGC